MTEPAVRFQDVSFSYRETPVLHDAVFSFSDGAFALVLGPNGGGKSTLGRLILGLLKPDSGDISVFGTRPSRAFGEIGYVPQVTTAAERFPICVADVVRLGLHNANIGSKALARQHVNEALEMVELSDLAARPFHALSGGQRQRVLIARALASKPKLLVLDEPTASIDTGSKERVYSLLKMLKGTTTIVLISHDAEAQALPVSDILTVDRHVKHRNEPPANANATFGQTDLSQHVGASSRIIRPSGHTAL